MKYLKASMVVSLFLHSFLIVPAQEKYTGGLQFFTGTWTELIKAAQQQDKMIFVDMYTDWCAPCKEMDRTVFNKKVVGDKYNPSFLNYKLNAEKGEGIAIAKKFNVYEFPTYLYLNSYGDLVYKSGGYSEPAEFNQEADKALRLGADSTSLGTMAADFKQGKREPAFLRAYIQRMKKLNQDNNEVLDAWFKSLSFSELEKEETIVFLGRNLNSAATPAMVYVMEQYGKLSAAAKQQITNNLFVQLLEHGSGPSIQQQRFTELHQLLAYADMLEGLSEKQRWYKDRIRLLYAGFVRDMPMIKSTGYRLAQSVKDISIDSIRREDARRYAEFIAPYLKGEKDSTQFATWQEEQRFLKAQYSNEVSYKLYFVANAFAALPDTEDKSLRDALVWARKAKEVYGETKAYGELVEKLEKRVGK